MISGRAGRTSGCAVRDGYRTAEPAWLTRCENSRTLSFVRTCAVLLLVACGSVEPKADAPPTNDLTFTGVVEQLVDTVRTPLAGAKVTLSRDDGSQVGSTTSDANGSFSIPITGALPLDGFYKIEGAGVLDSFSHLVIATSTDPASHILALSATELDKLATTAGTVQQPNTSLVIAQLVDASGAPLAGGTIRASLPGGTEIPVCYSSGGVPSCALDATGADGIGWMFSVPTTSLSVGGADANGGDLTATTFDVLSHTVVFTPVRP